MTDKPAFKICPFCKEEIRDAAVKCRYCGEWLESGDAKGMPVTPLPPQTPVDSDRKEPAKASDDDGAAATEDPVEANAVVNTPARGQAIGDYWYGYLYVAFCGYLTYCAASHVLAGAMKLAPVGDVAKQTEYWFGLGLWAGATAFFAYVTYRLARRDVSMGLIYTIVTLHGVSVLARGIYPGELLIWVVLSGIVVTKFRERKALEALEAVGATEDERYELLNKATRLETKGRVEEALAAYREIMEKFPDSPAGQDARKSLESLEAKVSLRPEK
jgi:hypothetical protein